MDWAVAFKEFGYPAAMSVLLLYIISKNLEEIKATLGKINTHLRTIEHILDIEDKEDEK